jgi:hypothetical protein
MKRQTLASVFLALSANSACSAEDPTPPVTNTTGGTAPTGGMSATSGAPTIGGAGGAPTSAGASGAATTGGASGASTGGAAGASTVGGASGATSGGSAGMAGAGGSAGTGGAPPMDDSATVATALHGHTILMPCQGAPSGRVCTPVADASKPCTDPGGFAQAYVGAHSHNEQVKLGGTPGKRYIVTLRIQGQVEAKTYTGGMDVNNSAALPANGLQIGGQPNNNGNGYNIYFIRTDSPAQHYFLNNVGVSGDSRVRHSTFPMDYQFDLEVEGGSNVCLVSADPNNSAIRNCAEPDDGSSCVGTNTTTVANLDPLTGMDIGQQPYNGQFVGVTVVKTVPKP